MSRSIRLFTFAAPSRFYWLTGKLLPWLWATAALFAIAGLYMGFFVAPTDATQGDAYRIIFIHVPAAWMSMVLYLVMAGWAVFGWAATRGWPRWWPAPWRPPAPCSPFWRSGPGPCGASRPGGPGGCGMPG